MTRPSVGALTNRVNSTNSVADSAMNSRVSSGSRVIARGHHGQHDRDGAAQAAPHQDHLVSRVDRLHEAGLLQHRQHAEHHEGPRQQGARRHRGHGPEHRAS